MKLNRTPLLLYAAMLLTLGVADAASAVTVLDHRLTLSIPVTPSSQVVIEIPDPAEWPALLVRALAQAGISRLSGVLSQESL